MSYREIIAHYGKEKQIIKCIEELSELQKELCKHLLSKRDKDNIEFEIADVMIMIEQLKIMFEINDEQISNIINYKIERTLERIKEE